jgi:hypothetical protein
MQSLSQPATMFFITRMAPLEVDVSLDMADAVVVGPLAPARELTDTGCARSKATLDPVPLHLGCQTAILKINLKFYLQCR